jgi:hypothetical protein
MLRSKEVGRLAVLARHVSPGAADSLLAKPGLSLWVLSVAALSYSHSSEIACVRVDALAGMRGPAPVALPASSQGWDADQERCVRARDPRMGHAARGASESSCKLLHRFRAPDPPCLFCAPQVDPTVLLENRSLKGKTLVTGRACAEREFVVFSASLLCSSSLARRVASGLPSACVLPETAPTWYVVVGWERERFERVATNERGDLISQVIAAKTAEAHPKLEGTIYTAAAGT